MSINGSLSRSFILSIKRRPFVSKNYYKYVNVRILTTDTTNEGKCPYPLLPPQCINNARTNSWFEPKKQSMHAHIANLFHLSKPRLTGLVTLTAIGGAILAPGAIDISTLIGCTMGTFMLSSAANSINQLLEVPYDSQMLRTQCRMLVTHSIETSDAIVYALGNLVLGTSCLFFLTNPVTTLLGLSNFFLYSCVYTSMKRFSILNTWLGSFVGAIPPLMGWAASTNGDLFNITPWLLASLLYSWQLPHFNALSWNLRSDYSRAGYMMMAVNNPELCRKVTLRHSLLVTLFSTSIYLTSMSNIWFLILSTPINLVANWFAYKFFKNTCSSNARTLHHMCLIQLTILMILLIVFKNKKTTDSKLD